MRIAWIRVSNLAVQFSSELFNHVYRPSENDKNIYSHVLWVNNVLLDLSQTSLYCGCTQIRFINQLFQEGKVKHKTRKTQYRDSFRYDRMKRKAFSRLRKVCKDADYITSDRRSFQITDITIDSHDKAFSCTVSSSARVQKVQTQRTHFSSFISSSAASVHSGELFTIFSETNRFSL